MSEFAPPKGQRCENCVCYAPKYNMCFLSPVRSKGNLCSLLERWCGHWRGKGVACGGCKHFKSIRCPRTILVPDQVFASHQSSAAFPCERYEEE